MDILSSMPEGFKKHSKVVMMITLILQVEKQRQREV